MGSTTTEELGLDLEPAFAIRTTANDLLREVNGDGGERLVKLEEFVRSLDEERRKIEAFKRELPFSFLIINEVVDRLKEELMQCRIQNASARPVLEEFMPVTSKFEEDTEKDEKMNWMSTAQLWSHNSGEDDNSTRKHHNNRTKSKSNAKEKSEELLHKNHNCENALAEQKYNVRTGEFLESKGLSGFPVCAEGEKKIAAPLPDLSLLSPVINSSGAIVSVSEQQHSASTTSKGGTGGSGALGPSSENVQSGALRKARRCWSPELHRRFLSALQQLGGSQVATPKQIRELMMVDGLTNDEVKSHLQKYRLHTRRLPASSTQANQKVFKLESLWVPPVASKKTNS